MPSQAQTTSPIPVGHATAGRKTLLVFLFLLFVAAFFVRVGAALHSPNVDYADETFETREPAHRLAFGGPQVTSWEYRVGARSWVFPAFLAGIMRTTSWMGQGSYGYLLGIILVLSLLSLTVVWFGFAWARQTCGTTAALICACACAFWFELVYFAPKTLNEVVATHLLLAAICIGALESRLSPRSRLVVAGLLCGLVVGLRMQFAPAVLVLAIYLCWGDLKRGVLAFGLPSAVVFLAFGLVDYLTWGRLFHSYIANFTSNIFENMAVLAGVRPWYWYFAQIFRHAGPVPLLALLGLRRSPLLGWLALAVLIPHSFIAHKDYRYIYPVIPIMITLAGMALADLLPAASSRLRIRSSPSRTIAASLVFFALISVPYWILSPKWKHATGGLVAFERLSTDSNVCGVAIYRDNWWDFGGYTYLHHDVPMYILPDGAAFSASASGFNVLVTSSPLPPAAGQFQRLRCAYGVCTFKRAGGCSDVSANEINAALIRLGE